MITVLENAQTRAKKTLNFVDHKGKVVGFNPMPDGERLRFQLRAPSGRTVLTQADMPLEHYLRGLACHFGPGISFAAGEDGERRICLLEERVALLEARLLALSGGTAPQVGRGE